MRIDQACAISKRHAANGATVYGVYISLSCRKLFLSTTGRRRRRKRYGTGGICVVCVLALLVLLLLLLLLLFATAAAAPYTKTHTVPCVWWKHGPSGAMHINIIKCHSIKCLCTSTFNKHGTFHYYVYMVVYLVIFALMLCTTRFPVISKPSK